MLHNDAMPRIEVDSRTFEVRVDGERLACEPARHVPLCRKYLLR
jgi:urease subunit alpha